MISIISPCLNSEKYINNCAQSVISQNIQNCEHLFIDGGSTDSTLEILYNYQRNFPHIRVFTKQDRGQSHAMNRGLKLAKYDLVSFLNVDDNYIPGALQTVIRVAETAPDYSFIVGMCELKASNGRVLSINRPTKLNFFSLLLASRLYPFPANPSAYFYDKKIHHIVGPYSEELHYTMDLEFILRMSRVANVIHINSILGSFTLHSQSKTISGIDKAKLERIQWQQKYVHNLRPMTFFRYKVARFGVNLYEILWTFSTYVKRGFAKIYKLFLIAFK
jgi:glycosyltransferase involved in cell wall biosynthesis